MTGRLVTAAWTAVDELKHVPQWLGIVFILGVLWMSGAPKKKRR